MPNPITIFIRTDVDEREAQQLVRTLGQMEKAAHGAVDALKLGVGIDIGGKLVNSIASLPGLLSDAVKRGVDFNIEMADSESGMARVIAKFLGLNAEAAKGEAAKAMRQIVELEPKTAGTLSSLVQGFMATSASALSAGMSVEQNIDLVGRFANALANANIPAEQLSQELRSIFSGNITADSALAKVLSISNTDVNAAKEAGNLYEFLRQKVGELGEAGDTFAVRWSSLQSAIDKALADASKPVFDVLKESLVELNTALQDPETVAALRALGVQIGDIVGDGVKLTEWAIKNADVLITLAKSVGILAVAFAAMKIKDVISGLALMAINVRANTAAIDGETAALTRHAAAQAADTAARKGAFLDGGANRRALAGISRVAGVTMGLGGLALAGADAYADSVNNESAQTDGISRQVSSVTQKYLDLIKAAASLEDREKIIKGINEDLATLTELRAAANERDADIINRAMNLLYKQRDVARDLTEEKLAQIAAAKKLNSEVAQMNERDEKLFAYEKKRAADLALLAEDRKTDAAIDTGDIDAIGSRIVDLQMALKAKPALKGGNLDDIKARDEERDALTKQIEQLEGAKKAAAKKTADEIEDLAKKNDDRAIAAMQAHIKLQEELGRERIEQVKASGATEQQVAEQRRKIEQEIADERLKLENRIGLLQKETADDRAAREAAYRADTLARSNEARTATRDQSKDVERARWDRSFHGDGIDGRVQRAWNSTGELLTEENGVAKLGRDRMGVLNQPSAFSLMSGPGWGGVPSRRFSDLAPAVQRPAQTAGGNANPLAGAGQGLNGAASSVTQAASAINAGAAALSAAASGLASSASSLQASVDELKAQVDAMGEGR